MSLRAVEASACSDSVSFAVLTSHACQRVDTNDILIEIVTSAVILKHCPTPSDPVCKSPDGAQLNLRKPVMSGIPSHLHKELHSALLNCGPFFASNRELWNLFADEQLEPFRNYLPEADGRASRVDATIAYLYQRYRADTKENVLVLLLKVLAGKFSPSDDCHARLNRLAKDLQLVLDGRTTVPDLEPQAAAAGRSTGYTFADEALIKLTRAVGIVSVPRVLDGRQERVIPGTAWLVTPALALTCWHVMTGRSYYERSAGEKDLRAQITNTVVIFDHLRPGEGSEYGVRELAWRDEQLDYALLRLADRSDLPLRRRGFLRLDLELPLTTQTQLLILQHPRAEPQQRSSGKYLRPAARPGRILYSSPTDSGASGAPVLNLTNLRAVALHAGKNRTEMAQEGTLLKEIMADLEKARPDLHEEIMTVQHMESA